MFQKRKRIGAAAGLGMICMVLGPSLAAGADGVHRLVKPAEVERGGGCPEEEAESPSPAGAPHGEDRSRHRET